MADPYTFTFDVQAYLKEQETAVVEAPEQGVMKRPVKDAEPVVENPTDSIKTRMANALKSVFPDSTALGTAPKGDTSAGRSKALNDWTVSTEPFMPRFLGDVPAYMALETPPVTTTELSPTIDTMAMQDAQEQAAIRSASGITESLGRPAPAGLGDAPVQPETPVIYEAGATVTNGKDSPVGSPTPAGLMSPPAQGGVSGVDTTTAAVPVEEAVTETVTDDTTTEATTASLTDLVYADFVDGKQEGDEAHVGQDSKNITLPGGVVPDGLVYKGQAHKQNKSVVSNFDKSKLDTSGAYKKVGSTTVRRSAYDSDKAFAKGVIDAFRKSAKDAAGSSWDSMSEGSKKAIVKIGWNKGEGWYSGSSAKSIYKELSKETPEPANLYSKILVGSTVKGGGASIGIAKARANAWNETISATGGKEITKINADNSKAKTAFKYYDAEGNLLHTEQTSRATSKYENKVSSVSKDSKGVW